MKRSGTQRYETQKVSWARLTALDASLQENQDLNYFSAPREQHWRHWSEINPWAAWAELGAQMSQELSSYGCVQCVISALMYWTI